MKAKSSNFILIFCLFFVFFAATNAEQVENAATAATGACTVTDSTTKDKTCSLISKTACTTAGGVYAGDNTTCEEEKTTEKVNMGAPTSKNTEDSWDFARSLLLNNEANSGGANLVKNRYSSVGTIVSFIIRYLFLAGGVVFFVLILISGYKLVFLGDKQKALSDVKKNLTTGIMGLLIMFAVFWIIRIIEAVTGLSILGIFGL